MQIPGEPERESGLALPGMALFHRKLRKKKNEKKPSILMGVPDDEGNGEGREVAETCSKTACLACNNREGPQM